ncbi:alpha-N-arabinofuranosidase [Actomonas aquatica]|uniref:non-reducing end alpha-L-arabinofuranosidase n=1 Tax=Actomonas aquatica TaxID=2866162 RepID=A0ABZ1CE20_9BACT|nr:alpha-N-arabinofuranosidase [Opitutus sp. WL0086]WRQ89924.1 alpha-N-arabinofuranosidase [Opitutus sp. WL0086]
MTRHRLTSLFASAAIALAATPFTVTAGDATLVLHPDQDGPTIAPEIYGHFAEHLGNCIYGGIWVGPDSDIPNTRGIRNDVVDALRKLEIPVLRWPGGCFADEYHWKDGIGPREKRPTIVNTSWGGVVESNAFGTHEFMDLVELLGCEAYISANVGSGTVQEMMEWVEYLTSAADSPMARLRRANGRDEPWRVRYLGVGNESWGCGGSMTPEYYADLYRRYATFVKQHQEDTRMLKIACGASGSDFNWTEVMMAKVGNRRMDGLSLHYYTLPTGNWGKKGSDTVFAEDAWFATLKQTLRMEELLQQHIEIMDAHDPEQNVDLLVDEWGTWYDAEDAKGILYQQNTLRDALVAAINLHLFQDHADRISMANIAQTVNVLQAMILTDGPDMILTPSYHAFEMLKVHQGGTAVPLQLLSPDYTHGDESIPAVTASASRDDAGRIHLSLTNADPANGQTLTVTLGDLGRDVDTITGRILTAPEITAHNTFDAPTVVEPTTFDGATVTDGKLVIELPAKSVVVIEI